MKTCTCTILPSEGHGLLLALEQDTPFSMVVVADGGEARNYIELEVWVDGTLTAHRVTLNANGTWGMTTEVVL